jgi:hypothetical protein|tara:strand:+ start:167 stop:430 length:264 start_codon:yes stop_codon:yes gene_type:complete
MQAWVIILVLYFSGNSQRVDIQTTDLIFKDPVICNEFRLSPDFQNELKRQYKGKGIEYVIPHCKPMKDNENKIIVNKKGRKLNEQRI